MLLEARNLTRHYSQGDAVVAALRDVSFEAAEGEFVAITGPSGSGKTTLMNLIGLLDRPTAGILKLAGEDVTKLSLDRLADIRNRQIGFVFQSYNLLPRITALENVELPLRYAGFNRAERERRAMELLKSVGLAHRAWHWPTKLSGGEQQRVAIARALATDPTFILADEPTGAIDSHTGFEILRLFQSLNRAGRTIVMVTHNEDVAQHASRIIELRDGKIVADNTAPTAHATRDDRPSENWHRVLRKASVARWESIRIAVRALQAGKARNFLTMLGIIIGVGAVIAMMAVGAGARERIAESIRSLGANLLVVRPGTDNTGGVRSGSGKRHTLTEADAVAIWRTVPGVEAIAPAVHDRAQIVHGNRNWSTEVDGTTTEFFVAREWPAVAGRLFTKNEIESVAKVAIIGATVAENLFGKEDPVGKTIRVRETPATVIGVLERKGQSPVGADQDDIVFVPISTAKLRVFGGPYEVNRAAVQYILVKTTSAGAVPVVQEDIQRLLRQRHRFRYGKAGDFTVRNLSQIGAAHRAAGQTMTLLLTAVASVALVVGGISIMNMMLVTVSERTREIGLRLAVGARRRDVRAQFLIEAILLALVGGAIGIIIGIGTTFAISQLIGWRVMVTPQAIMLAFGFAAAVGIFFGFYPANKASRLDPIEALRFE